MKKATYSAASILGLVAAAPAHGQDIAEGASATADIIVTAQRRAERTQDVPISITAISSEMLEQSNVRQLGDIVKLSPATRFDYQGNFVQPTIRGVGTAVVTSGGGSNVGIYLDGFYSPNPMAGDFQLLSVEGIQVLKGPQGTLFGRNTTGGAIIVTTAKPSTETQAVAKASFGRFNEFTGQAYLTTGLTENIAFDIEGSFSRGDGWVRNIAPTGSRHPGRFKNWSIRTGLRFEVSDAVSFTARYIHRDVDDPSNVAFGVHVEDGIEYSRRVPNATGGLDQLAPSLVPTAYRDVVAEADSVPSFRFKSDIFQLTGEFDLGFADLVSYSQYRKESGTVREDDDQSVPSLGYTTIPVTDKTFTQEFLMTSKPGSRLQWTAGLFYFNYVDRYDPLAFGLSQSIQFGGGRSNSRTQSIAGLLDLTYEIADNLFLTAGARYSHDKFDRGSFFFFVNNPAGGIIPLVDSSFPALTGDRVTPRAVIRYAIDDRTSVYASYSRGYKAAIVDVISGNNVKPEIMDAFELGFKHASSRFSVNVAGWYYDYKDLQASIYPDGLSQILNAGSARIYGVEGDVRYNITPDFQVTAGAAYVNAKYREFTDARRYVLCDNVNFTCASPDNFGTWQPELSYDPSGRAMQRAPKFTATLGANYGFDVAGGRMVLSGSLYHTSKFYFDLAQQFSQKSYELVGLRAEWTDPSDQFTLALYGDNVLGAKYRTQVLAHTPAIGVAWGKPATWGVSARYKFGQ